MPRADKGYTSNRRSWKLPGARLKLRSYTGSIMDLSVRLWHPASKQIVTAGEAGCVSISTQPGNPTSPRSSAGRINTIF
jgi:hypothetical protein